MGLSNFESNINFNKNSKNLFQCPLITSPNKQSFKDEGQGKAHEIVISLSKHEILKENQRFLDYPNRRGEYHYNFMKIQSLLGMTNNIRKLQIDAVLKKCKSKFFKSVHKVLKCCLKCQVLRLPQNFITDIKIDTNKKFMSMTILSVYQNFGIFQNMDELLEGKMVRPEKKSLLKEFLSQTFKVLFEAYLTSEQYQRDYEETREENENLAILFDYTCKIFTLYYTNSKGNNLVKTRKENFIKGSNTGEFQEKNFN